MPVTLSKRSSTSPKSSKKTKPTKKQIAKIPLTEEEHQKLIQPPRKCIERFRQRQQDANDWYIVSFRIRLGRYTAIKLYEQDVVEVMEAAYQLTLEMLASYHLNNSYDWSVTQAQIDTMVEAIDLIDQMQRDADRATLMFYTRKVYNEMIKYAE